jgi:hypothetical protein
MMISGVNKAYSIGLAASKSHRAGFRGKKEYVL